MKDKEPDIVRDFEKVAAVGATDYSKLDANGFKGPFKAFKMPQGHTLYMTPEMRENIPDDVMNEVGRITTGKDTLISTYGEYKAAAPEMTNNYTGSYINEQIMDGKPRAFGNENYIINHPLHRIAPNSIFVQDLSEFTKPSSGLCLPNKLFNMPEIKELWTLELLHEAGHIKDDINKNFFQKFFSNNEEETLATEAFADSIAIDSGRRLGLNHAVDVYVALRSSRPFMFPNIDKNNDKTVYDHDTSALLSGPLQKEADDHLEDAKRYFGEAGKVGIIVDDICADISLNHTDSSYERTEKKIIEHLRAPMDNSHKSLKESTAVNLCEKYAVAKSLLEQDKITDPEQKEYAESFVNSMQTSLNPDVLYIVESELVPAIATDINNGLADEIFEQHQEKIPSMQTDSNQENTTNNTIALSQL